MPISSGDLTLLRDSHPHQITPYISALDPAVVFVGTVNDDFDKNTQFITVDTVSGDLADVQYGMTVYITQDVDVYTTRTHKRRVWSAGGAGALAVDENGIAWQNGDTVTVYEDWELWSVFPKIELVGEDLLFYKDSGKFSYTDQNENPHPVAIIKGERCFIVDSFPITLTFTSDESYTIADGATITGYQWSLYRAATDVGTISGSSDTTDTFVVDVATAYPDGLWLELTVTDSNGNTQVTRRLVFVHDRTGDNAPYTDFKLGNLTGSWEQGGWRASIKFYDSLSIPENSHVILWHEATFGVPQLDASTPQHEQVRNYIYNQTEILLDGRIYAENVELDVNSSVITSMVILDIVAQLKKRRMFSISLKYNTSPTVWYEYYLLTTTRALHYLYKWHSTLLEITNVFLPLTGQSNTILYSAVDDFKAGQLYQMGDSFSRNNSIFAHLCANKAGELYLEIEYNMLDDSDRSAIDTAMTLLDEDYTGDPVIKFVRYFEARAWIVEANGVYFDGTDFTPLMSTAPGPAPEAMGEEELVIQRLALESQADLNNKTGRAFAIINNDVESITAKFASNYLFIDLMPQRTYYLSLASAQTGRDAIEGYAVPRNIQISFNQQDGNVAVEADFEMEADSYVGDTVDVPDAPAGPIPDVPDPPEYPTIETNTGDGFGTVYVVDGGTIGRTRDFSAVSPTWSDISPVDSNSFQDFILDSWNPVQNGYVTSDSGVWKSTDLDQSSPSWTLVLNSSSVASSLGASAIGDFLHILTSRNVQDYVATFFSATVSGKLDVYCAYSTDGGSAWSVSKINLALDTIAVWYGAVDYVPHLISGNVRLYCAVNVQSVSSVPVMYRSDDGGASWSRVSVITAVSFGTDTYARSCHAPVDGNESGDTVYTLHSGNTGYHGLWKSTDSGATWTNPVAGEGLTHRFGAETYPTDDLRGFVWQYSSGGGSITLRTTDTGFSSTSLASITGLTGVSVGASGGFPYDNDQFYAVTNTGIFVSTDRGENFIDKTGDWAFSLTNVRVIVPLWLAE